MADSEDRPDLSNSAYLFPPIHPEGLKFGFPALALASALAIGSVWCHALWFLVIPAFLLAPRRLPAKEHFLFFRVHRTKGKHGGSGQRFDLLQRIPGAAVKIRFCPEEALDYRPLQFGKPVECPLHRIRLQKPDQADQRVRILFPSAADHMPDRLDQFNIIARMEKVKREIKIGNYFYRAGQHAERLLHMSASAQLIQQPYRGSQEDTVHRIQILVLQKASRLKNSQ